MASWLAAPPGEVGGARLAFCPGPAPTRRWPGLALLGVLSVGRPWVDRAESGIDTAGSHRGPPDPPGRHAWRGRMRMTDAALLVERREGMALVTLNRPEKHNALSLDLLGRLHSAIRVLGDDDSVRVVILRGNDHCFSTGMDLDDLASVRRVADTHRALGVFRDANAAIERCPKPV